MSYARRGVDSHVHVHVTPVQGWIVCVACSLSRSCESWVAKDELDMIVHLGAHRLVGELVPQETLEELARDARRDEAEREG